MQLHLHHIQRHPTTPTESSIEDNDEGTFGSANADLLDDDILTNNHHDDSSNPSVDPSLPPFTWITTKTSSQLSISRNIHDLTFPALDFLPLVCGTADQPTALHRTNADYFSCSCSQSRSGYLLLLKDLYSQEKELLSQLRSSPAWFLFLLIMVSLFLECSRTHRSSICFLLSALATRLDSCPLIIPSNDKEVQSLYIGKRTDRKKSFVQSIPKPTITQLSSGNCYVSLAETFQLASASGIVMHPLHVVVPRTRHVYSSPFLHAVSPRGKKLLSYSLQQLGYPPADDLSSSSASSISIKFDDTSPSSYTSPHPVRVYEIILWSDSFDPSTTKMNRGSVWVLMATIAPPHDDFHTAKNTYLIGIGSSSVSHDDVFQCLQKELSNINSSTPIWSYDAQLGSIARSHLLPYVFLQDTPEKTSSNFVTNFRGNSTILFGYLGDLPARQQRLPSCQQCLSERRRSNNADTSRQCSLCDDWSHGCAALIKQDLTASMSEATSKFQSGVWSKVVTRNFLSSRGVAPSFSQHLFQGIPPKAPGILLIEPMDLRDFTEVPNHLFFLGLAKALCKDGFFDFLRGRNKWTAFVNSSRRYLDNIKAFNLGWLSLQKIHQSGTFGGWVSENHRDFSRLMRYFASFESDLEATDETYHDPDKPLNRFLKPDAEKWLAARGIVVTATSGRRPKRKELIDAIAATGWKKAGDPPLPNPNFTLGNSPNEFHELVGAFVSMISLIMNTDQIPSRERLSQIDRSVKIYLSLDHAFGSPTADALQTNSVTHPMALELPQTGGENLEEEQNQGDSSGSNAVVGSILLPAEADDENPALDQIIVRHNVQERDTNSGRIKALTKRNKINLLKVTDTIRHFGPFHFLNELNAHGEGSIRSVKPHCQKLQSLRNSWCRIVAQDYCNLRYLRQLLSSFVGRVDYSSLPPTEADWFDTIVGLYQNHTSHPKSIDDNDTDSPSIEFDGSNSIARTRNARKKMFVTYIDVNCLMRDYVDPARALSCVLYRQQMNQATDATAVTEQSIGRVFAIVSSKNSNPLGVEVQFLDDHISTVAGITFARTRMDGSTVELPGDPAAAADYLLLMPLLPSISTVASSMTTNHRPPQNEYYYVITYRWCELKGPPPYRLEPHRVL